MCQQQYDEYIDFIIQLENDLEQSKVKEQQLFIQYTMNRNTGTKHFNIMFDKHRVTSCLKTPGDFFEELLPTL